jgi:hypothetical protein
MTHDMHDDGGEQSESGKKPHKGNGATPPPSDAAPPPTKEELDREEEEYGRLRCDLPDVSGASVRGVVQLNVAKAPKKNTFFRTHPTIAPVVNLVTEDLGMDLHYYAVDPDMRNALTSIGIEWAPYTLYPTMNAEGGLCVIPVPCHDGSGERNAYSSTKEGALIRARSEWIRIYTDKKNSCYEVFPAPAGRFPDPLFPDFTAARYVALSFKARGKLIDNAAFPRFQAWAGLQSHG